MSLLGDILSDGLKLMEDLCDTPKIIWQGRIFPCMVSDEKRGTTVVIGAKELDITMTVMIRKTAESLPITVDSSVILVDGDLPLVDDDAQEGESLADITSPVSGKKLTHRGRQYRVLTVSDPAPGSHWELDLGSPQR